MLTMDLLGITLVPMIPTYPLVGGGVDMHVGDIPDTNDLVYVRVTIDHQDDLARRVSKHGLQLLGVVHGIGPGKRLMTGDDDRAFKGLQCSFKVPVFDGSRIGVVIVFKEPLPLPMHQSEHSRLDTHLSRRTFLNTATVASLTLALPRFSAATTATLVKPVQIGLIADLHHDVMHDGSDRLGVFLEEMSVTRPDAILQLGDFAYPSEGNSDLITRFNEAHARSLHVIGNHDTDAGFTKNNCIEKWGMPGRYYACNIEGIQCTGAGWK